MSSLIQPKANTSIQDAQTKVESVWKSRKIEMLTGGTLILGGAAASLILWPVALAACGIGLSLLVHGYLRTSTPVKPLSEKTVEVTLSKAADTEAPKVRFNPELQYEPTLVETSDDDSSSISSVSSSSDDDSSSISSVSSSSDDDSSSDTSVSSSEETLERMYALFTEIPYDEETATDEQYQLHALLESMIASDKKTFKFIFEEFAKDYPKTAAQFQTTINQDMDFQEIVAQAIQEEKPVSEPTIEEVHSQNQKLKIILAAIAIFGGATAAVRQYTPRAEQMYYPS